MPFDASTSDYFETKPAPVYDRDNAPQTMWDAIRLGVRDLEATEALSGYVINMSVWHVREANGCHVCFAGAIMARTLSADPEKDFCEVEWGANWTRTFLLLDHARKGFIESGDFQAFGIDRSLLLLDIAPYKTNPTAFKRDMLALADHLEREG